MNQAGNFYGLTESAANYKLVKSEFNANITGKAEVAALIRNVLGEE